ncbi:MAG: SEC-C domain-containing protein [Opitutus sp.]|nr:SEC-C domain-containing protein [Opitutus sp.]MCS6247814.1 SEC-C domain-containing protein [Opitutus sp.]MCS6276285.1 SEC-C domain-containing protein [Opitutus sp.]MCS6301379.1 SEC-C domain-containing protein [Opitutus sp.]
MHEKSEFQRIGGKWIFARTLRQGPAPVKTEPKVGRNDPCTCGSGKKFKKCCGA